MSIETLDCTQFACPMPIVRVSRAVQDMSPGETLVIEAKDPAFQADLEAWVRKSGNRIVEFATGDVQRAVIEKV